MFRFFVWYDTIEGYKFLELADYNRCVFRADDLIDAGITKRVDIVRVLGNSPEIVDTILAGTRKQTDEKLSD